jgi:hypothetical protein
MIPLMMMMRLRMNPTELSQGIGRVQHLRAAVRMLQLVVMMEMVMKRRAVVVMAMEVLLMHL